MGVSSFASRRDISSNVFKIMMEENIKRIDRKYEFAIGRMVGAVESGGKALLCGGDWMDAFPGCVGVKVVLDCWMGKIFSARARGMCDCGMPAAAYRHRPKMADQR